MIVAENDIEWLHSAINVHRTESNCIIPVEIRSRIISWNEQMQKHTHSIYKLKLFNYLAAAAIWLVTVARINYNEGQWPECWLAKLDATDWK